MNEKPRWVGKTLLVRTPEMKLAVCSAFLAAPPANAEGVAAWEKIVRQLEGRLTFEEARDAENLCIVTEWQDDLQSGLQSDPEEE